MLRVRDGDGGAIVERLSAVDIFAPLSVEETTMLAQAAVSHVFAPGETVIRAGDPGSSMFVVHNGRVRVQVSENGRHGLLPRSMKATSLARWPFYRRAANGECRRPRRNRSPGNRPRGDEEVFDTNPDLVESLSFIMAERRQGLAAQADTGHHELRCVRRHSFGHQALLRPTQ